jgi:protein disulfide-isomerase
MRPKTILFSVLFMAAAMIGLTSGKVKTPAPELAWNTDLQVAHELSQKTGKPIFAFFTGSDWCGWCMKLQRDVFAKEAFKTWADKNVVLLELDFPRRKVLPDALKQQNAQLQNAFQVMGYPTVWLFTMVKDTASNNYNINAFGSLGYPTGATPGQEEVTFLNKANTILGIK